MTRPIKGIALASGLVVMLIGFALAVTVWSYRNAVDARDRALDAAPAVLRVARGDEFDAARAAASAAAMLDPAAVRAAVARPGAGPSRSQRSVSS